MNTFLTSLLIALIAYEATAWLPRLAKGLIKLSIMRLPKRQRPRFYEEWCAHVEEVPGVLVKVWHALGFVIAARKMFPRYRRLIAYKRSVARGSVAVRITMRGLDLAIVVPAIIALAPLMLSSIAISAVGGPALFKQRRIGRNGRPFYAYKLRTMSPCHDGLDPPQLTRAGRFLRKTSIDELPQLFNVLLGEMSLVGPLPGSHQGSAMKPGLTGLIGRFPTPDISEPRSISHWIIEAAKAYLLVLSMTFSFHQGKDSSPKSGKK